MIIAGRLEPYPYWQIITRDGCRQVLETLQRVHDRQAAATGLARDADQHLVAVLGNVDGDRQGRGGRIVGGHNLSAALLPDVLRHGVVVFKRDDNDQ